MAAAAPADFAQLLIRTEPFEQMSSERRSQLLAQASSKRFVEGEQLFPENQPPEDVCILLEGKVCVFADLPGEKDAVFLEELGPGACVGWNSALSGTVGLRALATTDALGLLVAAPAFLEMARYDPVLKEAIFKKPSKGEVWHAVAAEIERRKLGVGSLRHIVEKLVDDCVARDWPEDEVEIAADKDRIWVVSGGEGVSSGARWKDGTGVLWARLIGLPAEQLGKALVVNRAGPPRESLRYPRMSSASHVKKKDTAPQTSDSSESDAIKEQKVSKPKWRVLLRVAAVGFIAIVLLLMAAAFWAQKQPAMESVSIRGTLIFSGESRNINAVFDGTLIELGIRPGQRIERGATIAVIRPIFDEARAKNLAEARNQALVQAEFCDGVVLGHPVKWTGIPPSLVELAREYAALIGELRVHNAIQRGGGNLAGLSVEERKRVESYFSTLRENRVERASSAARDIEAHREDLREAEDALREAQSELRVQSEAYSQLRAEKNDDAREEYAVAQRAIATLKRGVNQRQEVVNRIRKEIAAMNVPREAEEKNEPQKTDAFETTNAALASIEKRLRDQSNELRQLASENEKTLAQMRADNAPRLIQAAQRGLVVETKPIAAGTFVRSDTYLGRLVTRQSWQVQCRSAQAALLQQRQAITLVVTDSDGTTMRLPEVLDWAPEVASKNQTMLRLQASRDTWRDGSPVRIEATVKAGSLMDRWLANLD